MQAALIEFSTYIGTSSFVVSLMCARDHYLGESEMRRKRLFIINAVSQFVIAKRNCFCTVSVHYVRAYYCLITTSISIPSGVVEETPLWYECIVK